MNGWCLKGTITLADNHSYKMTFNFREKGFLCFNDQYHKPDIKPTTAFRNLMCTYLGEPIGDSSNFNHIGLSKKELIVVFLSQNPNLKWEYDT